MPVCLIISSSSLDRYLINWGVQIAFKQLCTTTRESRVLANIDIVNQQLCYPTTTWRRQLIRFERKNCLTNNRFSSGVPEWTVRSEEDIKLISFSSRLIVYRLTPYNSVSILKSKITPLPDSKRLRRTSKNQRISEGPQKNIRKPEHTSPVIPLGQCPNIKFVPS